MDWFPGRYEVIVTDETGCKKFGGYDVSTACTPLPVHIVNQFFRHDKRRNR